MVLTRGNSPEESGQISGQETTLVIEFYLHLPAIPPSIVQSLHAFGSLIYLSLARSTTLESPHTVIVLMFYGTMARSEGRAWRRWDTLRSHRFLSKLVARSSDTGAAARMLWLAF